MVKYINFIRILYLDKNIEKIYNNNNNCNFKLKINKLVKLL